MRSRVGFRSSDLINPKTLISYIKKINFLPKNFIMFDPSVFRLDSTRNIHDHSFILLSLLYTISTFI